MNVGTLLLLWTAGLLVVGTYTDLRWREVPDWLNFAAVAAGLGTRLIATVATGDYSFILVGLTGFLAALGIAYAMFYLGQWGGGDSKMLLGLGALLGLEADFSSLGVSFFLNALVVGAAYGLLWSIALALKHRHAFMKAFQTLRKRKYVKHAQLAAALGGLLLLFIALFLSDPLKLSIAVFAVSIPLIVYLGIAIKAVENGCMLKHVTPDKLTEGDWIVHDVKLGRKRVTGPDDLGISNAQIRILRQAYKKHKIKTVLIKEGMPFIPSFLIAFIVTITLGNVVVWLLL